MKNWLIIFLMLFASCAVVVPHTDNEIWQRVETLNRAVFETKDADALNDMIGDNVTYGHSGGNIEDKSTMIAKAVANKSTYSDISMEKLNVSFSGNTAIVRYNYRATEDKGDGVIAPLNLGILQVWEKDGKKWILLARQAVKIPPVK